MINPNIYKRVTATVLAPDRLDLDNPFYTNQKAIVNGETLEIHYRRGDKIKKPGRRYLYLCFSIVNETYYLKAN